MNRINCCCFMFFNVVCDIIFNIWHRIITIWQLKFINPCWSYNFKFAVLTLFSYTYSSSESLTPYKHNTDMPYMVPNVTSFNRIWQEGPFGWIVQTTKERCQCMWSLLNITLKELINFELLIKYSAKIKQRETMRKVGNAWRGS